MKKLYNLGPEETLGLNSEKRNKKMYTNKQSPFGVDLFQYHNLKSSARTSALSSADSNVKTPLSQTV